MHNTPAPIPSRRPRLGKTAAGLLGIAALIASAGPVSAHPSHHDRPDSPPDSIELPDASSAEGITAGRGSSFYAGDLFEGDIYRGSLRSGSAEEIIDAPDGRKAVGMDFSKRHELLAVAGGDTGQAYFYDTDTGETVAKYQLAKAGASFINDVTLTRRGAWFTNSLRGELYFVPIDRHDGGLRKARTLDLKGPAGETPGDFNLNGIAVADDGRTLVVAHSAKASLFTVNTRSGESRLIRNLDLPHVDGIVVDGRNVWAVQNMINQVSRIRVSDDLRRGEVKEVITDKLFQTPTTAALIDDDLAVVNAKFDTGLPPTADTYEFVIVDAFGED
ncbi:SMP-30/gluconolactonase/LRE family protein [Arthrobacter crystallopoietes]|uniref:SMP-30/gluconolactonase/LRE family protein n=1 Tax=Crystallibacter crystallopoietes TaxID=37928 RepID=UPI001ABE0E3A|nr:SMP-30/gluconolactonase/LRE family protein [Arthrobacter crystallopoietes]QTG80807.1 SMP-30/gluconolactonase/LRE family protein [Arthrobacter crystallopoietes]